MSRSTLSIGSSQLISSWEPPLSTRGRYIVDAQGKHFRLRSGNFHGASGTYNGRGDYNDAGNHHGGEMAYQTVLCLDRVSLDVLIDGFLELGINSIRLPFSNEMIGSTTFVPDHALLANPQLRNKTPLEVFDCVVAALTAKGLAVILNNHTVRSLWCCGLDSNARWNSKQTTKEWADAWVFMVQRYRTNPRVVGADLYNEVRRDFFTDPTWGTGSETDWYTASMEVAARIQREANPDILIIIEGINWVGIPAPGLLHYRPELQPVFRLSHTLPTADKLVYNAHFYAYTGPNATGAESRLGGRGGDPAYGDLSPHALSATFQSLAGYVATPLDEIQKHYTAPVWISEFGVGGRNNDLRRDRDWWSNFIDILDAGDFDYAIWPLVGWQEHGQGDLWAFNAYSSTGHRLSILDSGDWRLVAYERLAKRGQCGTSAVVERPDIWRMLAPDWGDQVQSNTIYKQAADVPGLIKAACPDGLRLNGLSGSNVPRGLCTDARFGHSDWYKGDNATFAIVNDERHVNFDWAKGYQKLQCAQGTALIGYSSSKGGSMTALCAATHPDVLSTAPKTRVVWFDRTSPSNLAHGSFAGGESTMGVCDDHELAVGYAFAKRRGQGSEPAALLCQSSDPTTFSASTITLGQAIHGAGGLDTLVCLLVLCFLVSRFI